MSPALHQSNGEKTRIGSNGEEKNFSRSWNRSYILSKFGPKNGVWDLSVTAWARWKDNIDCLGNGEINFGYNRTWFEMDLMFRPGCNTDMKTYQVDFNFELPILNKVVYFKIQYFEGYGESLIDYKNKMKKIGIGFYFQ